jgi:hypothetical protein
MASLVLRMVDMTGNAALVDDSQKMMAVYPMPGTTRLSCIDHRATDESYLEMRTLVGT